jgi:hypothetical protein
MKTKTIPGEELEIVLVPDAQAQLDADPELAAAFKEFCARMRQGYQDLHDGKYANRDEMMLALGAEPVERDEVIQEAIDRVEKRRP